jgi:hypothetical protein
MVQRTKPLADLNTVVQDNIKRILGDRTPETYCKEAGNPLYYVSGAKKGKRVSERALRYAISKEQSPRLDMIAAIAAKEGIPPHHLLIEHSPDHPARRWEDWSRNPALPE